MLKKIFNIILETELNVSSSALNTVFGDAFKSRPSIILASKPHKVQRTKGVQDFINMKLNDYYIYYYYILNFFFCNRAIMDFREKHLLKKIKYRISKGEKDGYSK